MSKLSDHSMTSTAEETLHAMGVHYDHLSSQAGVDFALDLSVVPSWLSPSSESSTDPHPEVPLAAPSPAAVDDSFASSTIDSSAHWFSTTSMPCLDVYNGNPSEQPLSPSTLATYIVPAVAQDDSYFGDFDPTQLWKDYIYQPDSSPDNIISRVADLYALAASTPYHGPSFATPVGGTGMAGMYPGPPVTPANNRTFTHAHSHASSSRPRKTMSSSSRLSTPTPVASPSRPGTPMPKDISQFAQKLRSTLSLAVEAISPSRPPSSPRKQSHYREHVMQPPLVPPSRKRSYDQVDPGEVDESSGRYRARGRYDLNHGFQFDVRFAEPMTSENIAAATVKGATILEVKPTPKPVAAKKPAARKNTKKTESGVKERGATPVVTRLVNPYPHSLPFLSDTRLPYPAQAYNQYPPVANAGGGLQRRGSSNTL